MEQDLSSSWQTTWPKIKLALKTRGEGRRRIGVMREERNGVQVRSNGTNANGQEGQNEHARKLY